ncbi:MAG: protein kinase [Planctomyces sp.]|nr:protein kinase [Planctomyces sp.]
MSNIIDDYELLNCLATGNVSQIWEAKQVSSGQTFAMKLLLPETLKESEHRAALKHEAAVGKSLDHPNIIKLFDVRINKKHGYFIMEYFRAPNLKSMLRSDLTGARVRLKRMVECISQAVAHMHEKGWVHRDIKPDNILINKGSEVRIIDFSLAAHPKSLIGRMLSSKRRTAIQGTRTYLAPELIERKPLAISADIYSLGVTMYEVLTGRPPFVSGNANELLMMHVRDTPEKPSGYNDNVTSECDALVMSMLAKKPEKRPQSMHEVFAAIRNMRLFKVDADEQAKLDAVKAEDRNAQSLNARLDSRVDAARTPEERAAVAAEAKRIRQETETKRKAAIAKQAAKKGGKQPAAPAPQPTAPTYGGMPAPMPGYPAPGMPMPGYGYPQPGAYPPAAAFPPGQFPPGQFPGGQFPPGQLPPGQYPGAPMPGQMPGQFPPGYGAPVPQGFPAAPQPIPRPAAPAPAQPQPHPAEPRRPKPLKDDPEDLPLMDELPEVI